MRLHGRNRLSGYARHVGKLFSGQARRLALLPETLDLR